MNNNQEPKDTSGCAKVLAAVIILGVVIFILCNLPMLLTCAVVCIFGIIGIAIIAFGFYWIYKFIQKLGGNKNVKS